MPNIKILSREVASKIAAGEVVERPASVLKELIENSLDAGATKIEIEIEKAGKKLIRVRDNGSGMGPEDIRLSVLPHSTSKISVFEDIDKLQTFGFRGEALCSIFVVSRLAISSCRDGADSGSSISGEGGRILSETKTHPVRGAAVEVKDIFFNTPARAKFLRSDPSERARLIRVVEEAALANPWTGFFLKIDKNEIFALPVAASAQEGADAILLERIAGVFGRSFLENLVKLERKTEAVSISGFVSKPRSLIASRNNQYFFVNKRAVSSKILQQALYRGYGDLRGTKHPECLIFARLSPSEFDVNIHPQKKDVKFKDENLAFKILSSVVAETIAGSDRPVSIIREQTSAYGSADEKPQVIFQQEEIEAFASEKTGSYVQPQEQLRSEWHSLPAAYLGQAGGTFLVFDAGGGLLILDQHAAQERILFEKYLDEFEKGEIRIQPLILPVSVDLSKSNVERVMQWKEWLDKAGFEIERFGSSTALLKSTPALFYFTQERLREFLEYLSEILGDPEKSAENVKRNTIAAMACRKSIKANDFLKEREASRLLEDLKQCKEPLRCPHGRPAVLYVSKSELAGKFQRNA
ncbi:MAG: DNA mismatch repair endonuclease MutL [Elusimicrobia bacterium]|nr:DNA mismatch repair endonuclease MutL [Elusimicrobiota bacterium]